MTLLLIVLLVGCISWSCELFVRFRLFLNTATANMCWFGVWCSLFASVSFAISIVLLSARPSGILLSAAAALAAALTGRKIGFHAQKLEDNAENL
jgi:hypothetical protein